MEKTTLKLKPRRAGKAILLLAAILLSACLSAGCGADTGAKGSTEGASLSDPAGDAGGQVLGTGGEEDDHADATPENDASSRPVNSTSAISDEEWGNLPFEEKFPPDNTPIEHNCESDGHRYLVTAYQNWTASLQCERCTATDERSAGDLAGYECDPSLFDYTVFESARYGKEIRDLLDEEIYARHGYITITGYRGSAEKVRIPGEIDGKKVAAVEGAFHRNDNLRAVVLDEGIFCVNNSFFNCRSLTEVWFGADLYAIEGQYSFFGCPLREVWFPLGVRSITGFQFCNFQKICLPCDGTFFSYGNPLTDVTFTEGYTFGETYTTPEAAEHLLLALARRNGDAAGGVETNWIDGKGNYLAIPFEGAKWDFTVNYCYDEKNEEAMWDCRYFLDESVWN